MHIQLNNTESNTDAAQRQVIDKFLDAIWTIAALIVVLETDKQECLMFWKYDMDKNMFISHNFY